MAGPGANPAIDAPPKGRLDKWLWHARFFKTRGLATQVVAKGKVRLNGQRVNKPGHSVAPNDVLTFTMGDKVRLIKVTAIGIRRGPASEAASLYIDLDAPPKGDVMPTVLE